MRHETAPPQSVFAAASNNAAESLVSFLRRGGEIASDRRQLTWSRATPTKQEREEIAKVKLALTILLAGHRLQAASPTPLLPSTGEFCELSGSLFYVCGWTQCNKLLLVGAFRVFLCDWWRI